MSRYVALAGVAILIVCMGCSKPDAMELLGKNRDAMYALKAYRADCLTELTYDKSGQHRYEFSKLLAEKPAQMRYDQWHVKSNEIGAMDQPSSVPSITFASDGTVEFLQFGTSYRKRTEVDPSRLSTILEPWEGFYDKTNSIYSLLAQMKSKGETADVTYARTEKVNGVDCDVLDVHKISSYQDSKVEEHASYYLAKSDHLVRRYVNHISFGDKPGFTSDATIRNIDTHPTVRDAVFNYTPPPGVVLETSIKRPELLSSGKLAPNFEVSTADKQPLRLSDFRGKVVVLDFWASWCGPCVESMPHTQEVAKNLSDSGVPVVVLAVDDGEPRGGFDDWVSSHGSKFPNLVFAYSDSKLGLSSETYRVSGIPTQYIIDKQGSICDSFVGYGGATDDLKNAIQNAYKPYRRN